MLADALVGDQKCLQVHSISLQDNQLIDQSVANLFDRASPTLCQSLRNVHIENNRIGPKAINSITAVLAESLKNFSGGSIWAPSLSICNNPLEVGGLKVLKDEISASKLVNLVNLSLCGSLTSDADTNAELVLALGSGHCHSLKELNLSRNNLGEPGGKALGKILAHLHSGVSLWLEETMLGDKGISAFAQNVEGTCVLEEVDFENNCIHAAGLSCFAEYVCAGKILTSFCLSFANNPLGLEGVIVFARMLSSCYSQFEFLDLSGCQLTTGESNTTSAASTDSVQTPTCIGDAEQLICSQSQSFRSSPIISLAISNNNFTGDRISVLKCFVYMCPCLVFLYCDNCGINSSDLEQLNFKLSMLNVKLPECVSWRDYHSQFTTRENNMEKCNLKEKIPNLSHQVCHNNYMHVFLYVSSYNQSACR